MAMRVLWKTAPGVATWGNN